MSLNGSCAKAPPPPPSTHHAPRTTHSTPRTAHHAPHIATNATNATAATTATIAHTRPRFEETRAKLLPLLDALVGDDKYVVRQHLSGQLLDIALFLVHDFGDEGYALFLDRILPHFASLVKDGKEEVRQAASEALVQSAHLVHADDLAAHILTVVLELAHDDDNEDMRLTAALLLNDLAPCFGSELCEQFVIPEVVSLGEDPAFRVRRQVALNMHHVCRVAHEQGASSSHRIEGTFVRLAEVCAGGAVVASADGRRRRALRAERDANPFAYPAMPHTHRTTCTASGEPAPR